MGLERFDPRMPGFGASNDRERRWECSRCGYIAFGAANARSCAMCGQRLERQERWSHVPTGSTIGRAGKDFEGTEAGQIPQEIESGDTEVSNVPEIQSITYVFDPGQLERIDEGRDITLQSYQGRKLVQAAVPNPAADYLADVLDAEQRELIEQGRDVVLHSEQVEELVLPLIENPAAKYVGEVFDLKQLQEIGQGRDVTLFYDQVEELADAPDSAAKYIRGALDEHQLRAAEHDEVVLNHHQMQELTSPKMPNPAATYVREILRDQLQELDSGRDVVLSSAQVQELTVPQIPNPLAQQAARVIEEQQVRQIELGQEVVLTYEQVRMLSRLPVHVDEAGKLQDPSPNTTLRLFRL